MLNIRTANINQCCSRVYDVTAGGANLTVRLGVCVGVPTNKEIGEKSSP